MTTGAHWVPPDPPTRAELVVAAVTVTLIAVLMLCGIGLLFSPVDSLLAGHHGYWGFTAYGYVGLMLLMSACVIAHSALSEDALRPRTILGLSIGVGGIGTAMALMKGWFLLFGAAFVTESWISYWVVGVTLLSILPFALPFTAAVILLRNDIEPVRWRVRAMSIAVGSAALVFVLALLVPQWVRAIEMGA